MRPWCAVVLTACLGSVLLLGGCGAPLPRHAESANPAGTAPPSPTPPQDLMISATQARSPASLEQLAHRRVIFIGEVHDRQAHHRDQLAVVRALHQAGVPLAIGLEAFQRPFQRHLDDYVAGRIGELDLRRLSDYDRRWGFDFALYRDVVVYARDQGIPLVALNAPSELVTRVSQSGLAALSPGQGPSLPVPPEPAQGAYRDRLLAAFGAHGHVGDAERLARFLDVQMLWDEAMAEAAADYLAAHPDTTLVILAGMVHVAYVDAIPRRLWRRLPVAQAWVFPDLPVAGGGQRAIGGAGQSPGR